MKFLSYLFIGICSILLFTYCIGVIGRLLAYLGVSLLTVAGLLIAAIITSPFWLFVAFIGYKVFSHFAN